MRIRFPGPFAVSVVASATACIPYTVGSSTKTAAPGASTFAASTYVIPASGDSLHLPLPVTDLEWRHGIDDHSDFGFRLMSGADGLVGNYKHRFLDAGPGQRRNNVILVPAVHRRDIAQGLEAARVATAAVEATTRPHPRRRRHCSLLCRLLGNGQ